MPLFKDDLWLGAAPPAGNNYQDWNFPQDGTVGQGNAGRPATGFGPMGRVYAFIVVPAALAANNIWNAQAVPGAGAIAAPNGALAVGGVATLDCARGLQVVSSSAGDTTQNIILSGTDINGLPQTQRFNLNGTTIVNSTKTFKTVTGAVASAALAGNLSVGTTDVFGLPAVIADAGYIINAKWNNVLATDAGTFVAADATSPATNLTGDPRGTYKPSANASNGVRRLVMLLALTGLQVGPNATYLGLNGVLGV